MADERRSRGLRRFGIGAALAVGLVGGGAGIAAAASPTPTPSPPRTPSSPDGGSTTTPGHPCPHHGNGVSGTSSPGGAGAVYYG